MEGNGESKHLLTQEEFFEWALSKMDKIEELSILSHTPIMSFEEEQKGIAKEFMEKLGEMIRRDETHLEYFMSEKEIRRESTGEISFADRIKKLYKWVEKWSEKENISIWIVKNGFFPKGVSIWYGKTSEKDFTLIKIRSVSSDESFWLHERNIIPGINVILERMKEEAVGFEEFVQNSQRDLIEKLGNFA